jgi:2-polyprenyl-3-methyl-5-hydroxy-6-metoxy-1,4-benzoquinol methylase
MKCRICQNETGNTSMEMEDMMYGTKEKFEYFQCGSCGCLQIKDIPADMGRHYPGDYYSYLANIDLKKEGFFKRLQCRSIIGADSSWIARLAAYKYKPPEWWEILKQLKLYNLSSPILDIGSGSGDLLKKFYSVGYKDLTGIDPYISKDIVYNDHLRIEKKTVFDLDRQYDAIMMHHSMEHMDRQEEVLKKIHSHLSPGGRVLIRIPVVSKPLMEQYGKHVVSLDPPRHFYIHTIKSFSYLIKKTGFITENIIYDAHEFSFWASEQYKNGISLHNHSESYLVKKTFSDEQMLQWKKEIQELNERSESDNVAIYLKKDKGV